MIRRRGNHIQKHTLVWAAFAVIAPTVIAEEEACATKMGPVFHETFDRTGNSLLAPQGRCKFTV